jgi:hypothetical protein
VAFTSFEFENPVSTAIAKPGVRLAANTRSALGGRNLLERDRHSAGRERLVLSGEPSG